MAFGVARNVVQSAGKVIRLPPAEMAFTAQAAALFPIAELVVRTRPLKWSARRFGVSLRQHEALECLEELKLSEREMQRIRAVRRLSPRIYGSERGCLRRSLVLGFMLRKRHPVMRLGMRKDKVAGFTAHAWLEIAGHPIEDFGDYKAFDLTH